MDFRGGAPRAEAGRAVGEALDGVVGVAEVAGEGLRARRRVRAASRLHATTHEKRNCILLVCTKRCASRQDLKIGTTGGNKEFNIQFNITIQFIGNTMGAVSR
ncbi:jg14632 [Pararge aegeria aegeria]|uniref:Jg14632 protein n=1 Tax=Pararge aegeria aegeria TaxID=348720 RepID=A0A8S4RXT5_9NEOP|nr:jg14632 [Pararge aegeria aegeria]